jgi:hypothetical protein
MPLNQHWKEQNDRALAAHHAAKRHRMKRWWYKPLSFRRRTWGVRLAPGILSRAGVKYDNPATRHDPTEEDKENKRLTLGVVYDDASLSTLDHLEEARRAFVFELVKEERDHDEERKYREEEQEFQRRVEKGWHETVVRTEWSEDGVWETRYHSTGEISTNLWFNIEFPSITYNK